MDASLRVKRVGPAHASTPRSRATPTGSVPEVDPAQTVTPVRDGAASDGHDRSRDGFDWRHVPGEVLLDPQIRQVIERDPAEDARTKLHAYKTEPESGETEKKVFERTV